MSILLSLLLTAAQAQSSSAAKAADRFALDLPTDETMTTPAEAAAAELATLPVSTSTFSIDTPIADLIADPRARAILDRDVPGLSDDDNLPKFKTLSLRRLAPLSGGQMTAALLEKVGTDLAAIGTDAPPAKTVNARRALPVGR